VRRAAAALALALLATAVALAGAVLGLRVAGAHSYDTELGSVSVRASPSWHGRVDAYVPIANWGVRANVFKAPLELHVEPRQVDRQRLLEAASGGRDALAEAERDARDAGRGALRRAAAWSVAGAFALGLVAALAAAALRRRRRRVLAGCVLAPVLIGAGVAAGVILRIGATFDAAAFSRPSFYARGAELGQLLQVADSAERSERGYTNSVQRTLSGYATLISAGGGLAPVPVRAPSVLVSDLHDNVAVLQPLRRLFTGAPVFFAGDFGQSGTRAEAGLIVPRVTRLGRPLVAVSGNHDSSLLMRRLARAGAIVLTSRGRLRADGRDDGRPVQRIEGLFVAGWEDPLEWRGRDPNDARRVFSFAERPDGEREYARAQDELVRWFEALRPVPDVVLVHQNGLAQTLADRLHAGRYGRPLTILTGHDHEQHVDVYGGIVVVDAGTAGAGGAFGVGSASVGVARLNFAVEGARLVSTDLIQAEPLSGAASADRIVLDGGSPCELPHVRCHDRPRD
jgi:predicted phosphodiesterase